MSNWSSFEAYNIILHKWTQALVNIGASKNLFKVTFLIWTNYLKKIGVAFDENNIIEKKKESKALKPSFGLSLKKRFVYNLFKS